MKKEQNSILLRAVVLLMAGASVVMFLMAAVSYKIAGKKVTELSGDYYRELTAGNTKKITDWYQEQCALLSGQVYALEWMGVEDGAQLQSYLADVMDRVADENLYDLYFVYPDNVMVSGSGINNAEDASDADFTHRAWYSEAAAKDGVVMTSPYTDAHTGRRVTTLSRRVTRNGEPVGVLAVDVLADHLNELLNGGDMPENSYGFLVDSEYRVMLHPFGAFDYTNEPAVMNGRGVESYDELRAALEAGKDGLTLKDYDGVKRTFYFMQPADSGWTVVTAVESGLLTEDAYNLRDSLFACATGLFLVFAVCSALIRYGFMNKALERERIEVREMVEDEQREKLEDAYESLENYKNAIQAGAIISLECNLTRDALLYGSWKYDDGTVASLQDVLGMDVPCSYDDYIDAWKRKFVDRKFSDKFHASTDRETLLKLFEQNKTEIYFDYWARTVSGNRRYLRRNIFMIRNSLGDVIAYTTVKDISEIGRVRELEDQARAAAEEANRAKTDFLFNMSHDIRTPMNAILGYTGIAEKKSSDPEISEYLRKIGVAGRQLLSLVNQVLEMSRIESGKIVLREKSTDLAEAAEITRTVYGGQAGMKGLSFDYELRLTHNRVLTDPDRMTQITNNIIGNAIKYTPEGGSIRVVVEEEPGSTPDSMVYCLTVADNGLGMSPEFLPRLFDEFAREENSTVSKIQGSGLGMSIMKKLVDLMGGTVGVSSERGKGTTFVVRIPMKLDTGAPEDNGAILQQAEGSLQGLKVLLVEDNEMNREIAEEILTDFGALVDIAEDGAEAVEKVKACAPGDYDVILMDVQMPRMNGYEATRAIRTLEDREKAGITIFAMTANAFAEDRQNALEAGMDGHLAKPIEIHRLLEALQSVKK